MKIQFSNAKIQDPRSKYSGQTKSLVIEKGKISSIESKPVSGIKTYDLKGSLVIPGIFDFAANIPDPGWEHKEDLISGLNGARGAGITKILLGPDADPFRDSKGSIEYVLSKSKDHEVEVLPVGGISRSGQGEAMSELLDLKMAGAKAFSNGLKPLNNTELLLRGLQYTSSFDGLVINRPVDKYLSQFGQMHEGDVSTGLGLKGIPDIAESLMVQRDLEILKYTGGRLHFSGISTEASLKLIAQARKKLNVTCDVSIHNLIFNDTQLDTFDSNFKVIPPLRSEKHRKSLLKGLENGIIDAITSDHRPQDVESKNLEFDLAEFGMLGFQTFVPNLVRLSSEISWDTIIEKIAHGPRELLNLENVSIEENSQAEFAVIDPAMSWIFTEANNESRSRNSPYYGSELTGKCLGLVNGESYHLELKKTSNA